MSYKNRGNDVLPVRLISLLICIAFILSPLDIEAYERKNNVPHDKVNISISLFQMLGGDEDLKILETAMPQILGVYFTSQGWSVRKLTDYPDEQIATETIKGKLRSFIESIQEKVASSGKKPEFIIKGEYFESGNAIRIDARVILAETGEVVTARSQTFDRREILKGCELLGFKIQEGMEKYLSKVHVSIQEEKKTIAVKCFEDESSWFVSSEEYEWIGSELSMFITKELGRVKTINVTDWSTIKSVCKAPLKDFERVSAADIVIEGEYIIHDRDNIKLSAFIRNIADDSTVGPIELSDNIENFFNLEMKFMKAIEAVLSAIISPEGEWKIQELFAGNMTVENYLEKGDGFSKGGNDALAMLMYKEAAKKDPKSIEPHYQLGRLCMKNRDYMSALKEFERVLELKDTHPGAYAHIGDIYFNENKLKEAAANYGKALDIEKSYANYKKAGDVYFLMGEQDRALEFYKKAGQLDENNADIYYSMGLVYISSANYQEALRNFEKVLEINPSHKNAMDNMAKAYYMRGENFILNEKYNEAIAEILKSIELKPSADAYTRLGWAYSKVGAFDKTKEATQKAIDLDPENSWAHAGLGRVLIKEKDYEGAIRELNESVRINPNIGFSQLYLGVALNKAGQNKLAMDALEKAWSISMNDYKYEWAAEAMTLAAEIEPDNAQHFYRAAESYRLNGNYDEAMITASKAIDINPESPEAYAVMGRLLEAKKDYDGAIATYLKAITLDPGYTWVHTELGIVYEEVGKYNEAVQYYQKAVELDPKDHYPNINLSIIYHSYLFDFQKAYEYAKKSVQLISEAGNNLTQIEYKSNYAESLLTVDKFDLAYNEAEQVLKLTNDQLFVLNMYCIQVSALLLDNKNSRALAKIEQLIESYKALPEGFENSWIYFGIKKYLEDRDNVPDDHKQLLLSMIDLLKNEISISEFEAIVENYRHSQMLLTHED